MITRAAAAGVVTLLVLSMVAGVGVTPAAGAASSLTDASLSPTEVETGAATDLSFQVNATGVDTGDGTTDARLTVSVADSVDLSGASVRSVSVTPNASAVEGTVDADANTVSVEWVDAGGVAGETLTISVTVDGVVVTRTGSTSVTASVDADATGGDDASGTLGTLTAAASGSDRGISDFPARLFFGEENVDLTNVEGVAPAGSPQRFVGVSGPAEGIIATADDTRSVDVTASNNFEVGAYNLSSSDGSVDVTVSEPRIVDLSVYSGDSTTVEVTNGSVPTETETLTVEAEFNFDEAESVNVSVEDERLDITRELTSSPTITTSGGTVTLDVSDLRAGEYTITAEGSDDLDQASKTVTLRVRDPAKSVTLSKTRVVRGDPVVASVAGAPGDLRYLRISGDDLPERASLNTATARELFDQTDLVQSVGANTKANYVYALVTVDDDGISEVRVRTESLNTGTVDLELAPSVDGPVEDDVTLSVEERTVTVSVPSATTIGETLAVSGTAPESDQVKLYADVGGEYVPLYTAIGDELAEAEVQGDGTWDVDVDTSRVIDLSGSYRIVAVADPGSELGSSTAIDSETLRTLEPRGATTVQTVEGRLDATVSRETIAATGSDEFTLSGVAVGQTTDLRVYRVGPRGTVEGWLADVDDSGEFELTIDGLDRRGVHTFVVVSHGRDGTYAYADSGGLAVDGLVSGSESPDAALAKLRDAYDGAGVDDGVVLLETTATDSSVAVSSPAPGAAVGPSRLSVQGQSTVEDGSAVFVELLSDDGVVVSTDATVTAGRWNTTLDLTAVPDGSYTLVAETTSSRTAQPVTISTQSTASSTPTPAPATERESTPEESETPTKLATDASTSSTGSASTPSAGTTSTEFPGFGPVALVGALVVLLFAVRRAAP